MRYVATGMHCTIAPPTFFAGELIMNLSLFVEHQVSCREEGQGSEIQHEVGPTSHGGMARGGRTAR